MDSNLEMLNFTKMHYDMDPATEDLLADGEDLRDGMIVMIEAPTVRENPAVPSRSAVGSEYALARLKEANRWCEVTNLKYVGFDGPDTSRQVQFIGVYADGTKRQRRYAISYAWFVKKSSLPKAESNMDSENDQSDNVGHLLSAIQFEHLGATIRNVDPDLKFKQRGTFWALEIEVQE